MEKWITNTANKLPFKIEGKYFDLKVFEIRNNFKAKGYLGDGWPYTDEPKTEMMLSAVKVELTNKSTEDCSIEHGEFFVIDSKNIKHLPIDMDVVYKYNFGSQCSWKLSAKSSFKSWYAFKPMAKGTRISSIRFKTDDIVEQVLEIIISDDIPTTEKKTVKTSYSDEKFYIDKINQISDTEIRGNAFRIFLTGKKTNKDSDIVIDEIINYLEKNNQLSDDIKSYFQSIKEEKVLDEIQYQRESIPTRIKDQVWRRDQGQCVECGSNEKLEFDHIIPISKGGANSYRNIQLLCEPCNRRKSAKIG